MAQKEIVKQGTRAPFLLLNLLFATMAPWIAVSTTATTAYATAMTPHEFGPLQFQAPNTWTCQTDAENYICLSPTVDNSSASAIVVSYKLKSTQDNLDIYQDQLGRPRPLQNNEVQSMSVPKGVRRIQLNSLTWIEGIQLGSEVQNYYTHYYATTTNVNAILASISIPEQNYAAEKPTIQSIISTFKIKENTNYTTGAGSVALPGSVGGGGQKYAATQSQNSKTIVIMGKRWPKMYLLLGLGLIVTLALLAYAILLEYSGIIFNVDQYPQFTQLRECLTFWRIHYNMKLCLSDYQGSDPHGFS